MFRHQDTSCVRRRWDTVAIAGAQVHDPRVGLKAGATDAGVAAKHMELVANVPKPPGFFDPKPPAAEPTEAPATEAKPRRHRPPGRRRPRPLRPAGAAAASPSSTPTWRSVAITSSSGTSRASTSTTSRNPKNPNWSPRSSAPAARGTSRCTATCCSCRWSRHAAASTAARKGSRRR